MNRAATFLELLEHSTSRVLLPDGSTVTGPELVTAGRAVACRWVARGLGPGDRIAVCLPNGRAYLEALAACAAGRHVLVSVNARYSASEAADLVHRSGAVVMLDPTSAGEFLGKSPGDDEHVPLDDALAKDPFVVFTTSGTTNKPKMVLHTQGSIARHGADAATGLGYRSDDVSLVVMPLCGTFGMSSLTASLAAGTTVVLSDGFDAAAIGEVIATERVSVVNGSDDMFHRLLLAGADLRTIRSGGYARFNSSLDGIVARAEGAGATLHGLYGMSECQALFAGRSLSANSTQRALAAGRLVSPDAAYRIEDGELWVRGPSLFLGYLAEGGADIDRELTLRAHSDGWFRTGDAVVAEDDRTFTYITRLGDTLRLGGFLVAPADIEQTILEVDGIDEAQVVAVDLPTGARPVAFVIAPGGIAEEAVIAHCRERLARYKVPVRVLAVPEFPTTPSANGNKIQSMKLRAMAAELLA